jgi:hypothetical protein
MSLFRKRRPAAVTGADAIAQADALAADGHALDAIDVLVAANHAERDAAVESRLLHLRSQAFRELDPKLGRDAWPPTGPDRFSGVVGLPEVPASGMTADAVRSGIVDHGALVVRGLVGRERVAQLIDGIDHAFAAHDAFVDGTPVAETAPWYVPFEPKSGPKLGPVRQWVRGGGGVLTIESPRAAFDVLDTFTEIGLAEALSGYLGERPVLAAKKWTLRRVPIDSSTNWHQDGAFLGEGIRAVNVWIALTHCGEDAPGLDVLARRLDHIAPTGTEGAMFDWSVGEAVVEREAEGAPIMRPIFEAGDALLFDDMFLHRTAVGPAMARERYAIESWFFAPSHYPGDQIPVTF